MENTITVPGWRGRLNAGLPLRQLQALLGAAQDKTFKQIARDMGISECAVGKRLDDARLKLGNQRTAHGAVLEAWKRGIIAPLAIALLLGSGHNQPTNPIRRPTAPRSTYQVRVARKVDELAFVA
jgi:DNA-binding CsgD family transcriptional regulator